jgi:hypothetical protein
MSEAPTSWSAASAGAAQSRAISLDERIALNDEISALAWAGVPFERGLAGDLPGRLGDITDGLAKRLGR